MNFQIEKDVYKLVEHSKLYNDGKYHIVRFIRNEADASLYIDNYPASEIMIKSK